MATPSFQSANALLEKYSDPDVRDSMLRLYELTEFLSQCIIRRSYKIPDRLNDCLRLTDYGKAFVTKASKKGVPTKTARLTCLLEFSHMDMLVDAAAMDVDAVAAAISEELLKGNVLLPFVHGPALYSAAAELFEDRRRLLSPTDSLKLLQDKPVGVFHFGPWLSGPFGILRTEHRRGIPPSHRVPLQHCHDVGCRAVHVTRLQSDANAEINRYRSDCSDILREESDRPSEFGNFLAELIRDLPTRYDDLDTGALPYLLGDGFGTRELRELLRATCERSAAHAATVSETLSGQRLADYLATEPDRAALMQLLLLAKDQDITASIDDLVLVPEDPLIEIPGGEVRRSVLTRAESTTFGNRPEVSSLGFRINSGPAIGPMRLRRLVEELYPPTTPEGTSQLNDVEELSWHLRDVNGITVAARLDEYLRSSSPDEVIRRLVMTSKASVDIALQSLGLAAGEVDDDLLVDRMLWKLGFDPTSDSTQLDRFWVLHERMAHGARSANVSTIVDQEAMRGLGANYFVSLERLLSDTINFAAWALTVDHISAKRPFSYAGPSDASFSMGEVRSQLVRSGVNADRKVEKWTLFPLISSFASLADHLEDLASRADSLQRAENDFPEFAGHTSLETFPFRHLVPFLDLTSSSQAEILRVLRGASQALLDAKVHEVRNEQLHYRRASSSLDKLMRALGGIEHAVRSIEDAGFTRALFHPDRHEGDRWGRSTHFFSDRAGREVAFGRPSSYSWLNLPSMKRPQYLVHAAQFAEPNEVLRFAANEESEFRNLWTAFPLRRSRTIDWSLEASPSGTESSEVSRQSLNS